MKNISVIYWSGTGNTEAMAEALAEGAKAAGGQVKLVSVDEVSEDDVKNADAVALGCPSMGDEVLEEGSMEPFIEQTSNLYKGKNVALFGSYGWGSGQWMEDWQARMEGYRANLVEDGLIINYTPDDEGLEKCKQLGESLVKA
ncbi:flavodoxin [Clostridium tetani]|uniref:flavodoxin n=1 Tax=Clostridium tetani TaxID=1513 RepID=UPI00051434F4|nr:flavodoxin [Clostridium tetani]KGI37451.1 flavodoxin [Clostridium tetani ATCC 9441]RXM73256.1 flavodoxin [Clostridium tetani]